MINKKAGIYLHRCLWISVSYRFTALSDKGRQMLGPVEGDVYTADLLPFEVRFSVHVLVNPKGLGLLPRGQGERAMCFSDLPGITSGCSLSVDTAPGTRPDKKQAFSKCFLIK